METAASSGQGVLQLRAVLRGISPLIWRRLLVRVDTSIAQLHHILQVAFGWQDMHLHRFEIRGREYGIHQEGGPVLRYRRSQGFDRPTEAAAP
ncbi:plasmid pRiA4b ORF-3 family protein [Variovorax sp. LjRoot175]|uniref:plasmid pRiA4b ORF-3 family protein n=1 Tax=Variovorax sp. LjRoot175 TaxID=3342276 RepID=UPI003F516E0C